MSYTEMSYPSLIIKPSANTKTEITTDNVIRVYGLTLLKTL